MDVSELERLQDWMAALIRRRRALPGDRAVENAATVHVGGNPRLSPVEQLEIYREQFWLRHTAALLDDYPGLSALLGRELWERLVEEYLEEVAPASWSLRDLGERLPAHVERSTFLPHPALSVDMARLEWAYVELFDAEDAPLLDAGKLAAIPPEAWESARVVFAPAVRLLEVRYPVVELRRRLRDEGPDAVPPPEPCSEFLVLYRTVDRTLASEALPAPAFELVRGLRDGLSLGVACGRVAERFPDRTGLVEAEAGRWFLEWGRHGWITDVDAARS
jgi:hypothetical protein